MSVLRAFIAVDLPKDLHQKIKNVSDEVQEILAGKPVRWVAVPKIHLSIKFLGDVSEKNIPMISGLIQAEADKHKVFELSIGGFGVFPNLTRPRVIWVGVEAEEELFHLQHGIEGEMTRLGYPPDVRKFNPHLTLGRVSRNAAPPEIREISELLRNFKVGFLGAARISEIALFRSDLKPGGAVYTRLFTAPFK